MIDHTIIQAALSSIEAFNGTKGKFRALTESIEKAAQILGESTICITQKGNCPYNIHLVCLIVMQHRLLPNWNKVWISSLMSTCTV